MSYPLSLDEHSDLALRTEIARRKTMYDEGLCDYCYRQRGAHPTCKFPARHERKEAPVLE
jgi:3-methyladenine DNA glycosylase Mpg